MDRESAIERANRLVNNKLGTLHTALQQQTHDELTAIQRRLEALPPEKVSEAFWDAVKSSQGAAAGTVHTTVAG